MAWIIAAGALASAALNSASQNQASKSQERQTALQSAQERGPAPYEPTASAAQLPQQSAPSQPLANEPDFRPRQNVSIPGSQPVQSGPTPQASPAPTSSNTAPRQSSSNTLDNVNTAAQIGSTLQQIFAQQQAQGQNARSQALASGANRQTAPQYQATANDPRLQQLLGGRY